MPAHPSTPATRSGKAGWLTPPPTAALALEWVRTGTPGHRVLGSVQHAGHPYLVPWPKKPPGQGWLTTMANGYLAALQAVLRNRTPALRLVPEDLVTQLDHARPATPGALRWLSLGQDIDGTTLTAAGSPHCSYWVRLASDSAGAGTLVLLAGRALGERSLGGDVGLRLVVHVQGATGRILGVVASGLWDRFELPQQSNGQPVSAESLLEAVRTSVQNHLGGDDPVWIDGLAGTDSADDSHVALRAWGHTYRGPADPHARGPKRMRQRQLRFYAELNNVYKVTRLSQRREVRSSCAAAVAVPVARSVHVVPHTQVPKDRRPPRLDGARDSILWPEGTLLAVMGSQQRWLEVQGLNPERRSAASATGALSDPERALTLSARTDRGLPLPAAATTATASRSGGGARRPVRLAGDRDAALHAYLRGQHLFERLQAYGFSPEAYFRFARLPLVLRPKASFSGMPEGDSPAAEVRPFFSGPFKPATPLMPRPQLLVKFGSADAHDREVGRGSLHAPERARAQYLGVAADARWAWHEFGHVLSYASTGELEFEFAHSIGDALAAITCDPLSDLAPDPERRGETFPWIQVPGRRHDRQARLGHCFCGRRNLLRLLPGSGPRRLFQSGYFEEQLLSSALFRLYRCIGGDTHGETAEDRLARLTASEYTVYLIMRALALLGPDDLASARTPEQWVNALVDADQGQARWSISAPTGAGQPGPQRPLQRAGGQLAKVIRWAFEQQGLYATDDPEATVEGLGQPPAVDLYLPDQRTAEPGAPAGGGGYWPVRLNADWADWTDWTDWADRAYRADGADRAAQAGTPPPAWWAAAPKATPPSGKGLTLTVQVGNRGQEAVVGAELRAWVANRRFEWAPLGHARLPSALASGEQRSVRLDCARPPADTHWLLLRVHHDADPCLLDGANPAWPSDATALMHLVNSDNNLGLCPWPASSKTRA